METNIPNNAIELTVDQRVDWLRKNRPEVYEERCVAMRGPADYKDRVMDELGVPRHLNCLVRLVPLAPLIVEVENELLRATSKFPEWSDDPQHAVGVLGEEFGELTREVVQLMYEPHKSSPTAVRTEAVQVVAMAFRFLRSMGSYVWKPATRHNQQWDADVEKVPPPVPEGQCTNMLREIKERLDEERAAEKAARDARRNEQAELSRKTWSAFFMEIKSTAAAYPGQFTWNDAYERDLTPVSFSVNGTTWKLHRLANGSVRAETDRNWTDAPNPKELLAKLLPQIAGVLR